MVELIIAGTRPNYISEFSYKGHDFLIHRPVTEGGIKLYEGWAISNSDGSPLSLIKTDSDTKSSAVAEFKRKIREMIKRFGEDELTREIEMTADINKEIYNGC